MSRVVAVVLAAGEGSRFGGAKQRLLLPMVLERLGRSPVDAVVVVEGAHPIADVVQPTARVVRCADWALGPGASLRCALAVLEPDVEAALVVLADGPLLAPEAVRRVLESWRALDDTVVAASYGGVRGHPLVVARAGWDAVPDGGLRTLTARLVPCDDLGAPGDVDTLDDLPSPEPPAAA
jgi:CTP:molybdopterin cytidylyltransferase MocA